MRVQIPGATIDFFWVEREFWRSRACLGVRRGHVLLSTWILFGDVGFAWQHARQGFPRVQKSQRIVRSWKSWLAFALLFVCGCSYFDMSIDHSIPVIFYTCESFEARLDPNID